MTTAEQHMVMRLAQQEPGAMLALLARCLEPIASLAVSSLPVRTEPERRPGDDPFLITEEEFSYRAKSMSLDEQKVLRCRVNAARAHQKGWLDDVRKLRQQADRLERKLLQD